MPSTTSRKTAKKKEAEKATATVAAKKVTAKKATPKAAASKKATSTTSKKTPVKKTAATTKKTTTKKAATATSKKAPVKKAAVKKTTVKKTTATKKTATAKKTTTTKKIDTSSKAGAKKTTTTKKATPAKKTTTTKTAATKKATTTKKAATATSKKTTTTKKTAVSTKKTVAATKKTTKKETIKEQTTPRTAKKAATATKRKSKDSQDEKSSTDAPDSTPTLSLKKSLSAEVIKAPTKKETQSASVIKKVNVIKKQGAEAAGSADTEQDVKKDSGAAEELEGQETVRSFAKAKGIPLDRLQIQLKEALSQSGQEVSNIEPDQPITPAQKDALLNYLTGQQKKPVKLSLKTRQTKEVSEQPIDRSTVRIERRQKRVLLPPEPEKIVPAEEEAASKTEQEEKAPETATSKPKEATTKEPSKKTAKHGKKPQADSGEDHRTRVRRRVEVKQLRQNAVFEGERHGGRRKKKKAEKQVQHGFEKPVEPIVREVVIPESISVGDLAQKMAIKAVEVIKVMMGMGVMVTINQIIDQDTAVLVVEEMGHIAKPLKANAIEEELAAETLAARQGEVLARAPVVTIMGHVDHGKTSLLDYIRKSRVAVGEAGGITQHIGAYVVSTGNGRLTFLDTPGHAAFTSMRARGANCTDVVILVVAADDGVMPQTLEAVTHARAAKVPLVVAVNKIDKPEADPEKVKSELASHDVIPEDWGGDVQYVNVSAKEGTGVDELLTAVLLQSEMLELKAIEDCPARGVVIESCLDRGRGVIATVLVQEGTLRKGDMILAGKEYGRVRAMIDDTGQFVETAGPSVPVQVLGLSGVPNAGEEMTAVEDERRARDIALYRQEKFRDIRLARQQAAQAEGFITRMENGDEKAKILTLLIKADVQGSLEAIEDAIKKLANDEVKVNVIASGIGGINESDIQLALSTNAEVIGFNVRADATARRLSKEESVKLHYYSVIYELIDAVKNALSGLLAPEIQEKIIGLAQVRDVFRSSKLGAVAGSMVIEGVIKRNNPIRVLRDNVVIFEGQLESLRRFKEDVSEVRQGTECGIGVKNYNDVKAGDQIEVYERIEVKRTL